MFVFLQLIGLYKDPEGDSVFRDSSAKGGICNVENQLNLTGVETTSLKFEAETSVSLRKRIKSLEDELEKMRVSLQIKAVACDYQCIPNCS